MAPRDTLLLAILILLMGYVHESKVNNELQVQVSLYREQIALVQGLRDLEGEVCLGIYQINALCERTILELVHRLGLDLAGFSALSHATIQRAQLPHELPPVPAKNATNPGGIGRGNATR